MSWYDDIKMLMELKNDVAHLPSRPSRRDAIPDQDQDLS